MNKTKPPFDPSKFGDPIAKQTKWTPAITEAEASIYRSHKAFKKAGYHDEGIRKERRF